MGLVGEQSQKGRPGPSVVGDDPTALGDGPGAGGRGSDDEWKLPPSRRALGSRSVNRALGRRALFNRAVRQGADRI